MSANYVPLFSPKSLAPLQVDTPAGGQGDRAPANVYLYSDKITLAVNVALATGRPLLVRGTSGSGKTSLARSVAAQLGWNYCEAVVTARTQARDLQWTVDMLRRLQDAQLGQLSEDWNAYVNPGVLWWAFAPASASNQQRRTMGRESATIASPADTRTVLLIDEIDKADPDVPNNLLRPLGDLAFEVEETGQRVEAQVPPLVVITTNEERDLPPAFLRRCVELNMPAFDRHRLVEIGRAHFPDTDADLLAAAADLAVSGSHPRDRREPNPAEYLDVLRACQQLGITPASAAFRQLVEIALGTATGT